MVTQWSFWRLWRGAGGHDDLRPSDKSSTAVGPHVTKGAETVVFVGADYGSDNLGQGSSGGQRVRFSP